MTPEPMSTHQRKYDWADPRPAAAAMADTSGRELLEAMRVGKLPPPPIAATLGIDLLEVHEGRVAFGLKPQEWHYNQTGSAHGSVHAALLDSAMGCAVHSRLPAGAVYTTLDLSVRYLRPLLTSTGPVRCEGEVVSLGSRVATASGRVVDSRGKVLATGTTSCLLWRDGSANTARPTPTL